MAGIPLVSVVVPLAGGPSQALHCLQGIAAQADDPPFEVIIIDDASVGLESLLTGLAGDVEVVPSPRRLGFVQACRLGAEHARGDVIVLVREAAVPAAGWLAPLVSALDEHSVGLTTSVTVGQATTSPVAAWSVAIRRDDYLDADVPDVPSTLAAGALALNVSARGSRVVIVPASTIAGPGARTGGARRAPGEAPELTVVIPTLDAASGRTRACVAAIQTNTDAAHEIVIVDNGSPPQGFTAPVNAGVRAARTPYVVIMNDDVTPQPGWWPPLRAALDGPALVSFPLTIDGAMRRDFAAWCFAITREGVDQLAHAPGEFFDPSLVVWYQDTDLLVRLRKLGRPPMLVESSRIRHGLSETVASVDPILSAWIRARIGADRENFIRKHPDAALHGITADAA